MSGKGDPPERNKGKGKARKEGGGPSNPPAIGQNKNKYVRNLIKLYVTRGGNIGDIYERLKSACQEKFDRPKNMTNQQNARMNSIEKNMWSPNAKNHEKRASMIELFVLLAKNDDECRRRIMQSIIDLMNNKTKQDLMTGFCVKGKCGVDVHRNTPNAQKLAARLANSKGPKLKELNTPYRSAVQQGLEAKFAEFDKLVAREEENPAVAQSAAKLANEPNFPNEGLIGVLSEALTAKKQTNTNAQKEKAEQAVRKFFDWFPNLRAHTRIGSYDIPWKYLATSAILGSGFASYVPGILSHLNLSTLASQYAIFRTTGIPVSFFALSKAMAANAVLNTLALQWLKILGVDQGEHNVIFIEILMVLKIIFEQVGIAWRGRNPGGAGNTRSLWKSVIKKHGARLVRLMIRLVAFYNVFMLAQAFNVPLRALTTAVRVGRWAKGGVTSARNWIVRGGRKIFVRKPLPTLPPLKGGGVTRKPRNPRPVPKGMHEKIYRAIRSRIIDFSRNPCMETLFPLILGILLILAVIGGLIEGSRRMYRARANKKRPQNGENGNNTSPPSKKTRS